jgi:hypothetical protein
MNMIAALGDPSPKTVWVAFLHRSQALQLRAALRSWSIDPKAEAEIRAGPCWTLAAVAPDRLAFAKVTVLVGGKRFGNYVSNSIRRRRQNNVVKRH